MSRALLWILSPLLPATFWLHDTLCAFIVRHIQGIKRTLLIVAHLSLFGFFFPELRLSFGSWASNLLIFLLFISPLSKIFRMRLLLLLIGLRREMGIMMAYLATVHGLGYLMDPDWATFILWEPLRTGDWNIGSGYILGVVTYILTLPLLLTSNDLAKRYLGGKRWKNLHTIVYLMFIFAI
ncbi:MAG: ferric reductase-like transmembrane domain-containing protein, partial [Patescibacteria group bacterium]